MKPQQELVYIGDLMYACKQYECCLYCVTLYSRDEQISGYKLNSPVSSMAPDDLKSVGRGVCRCVMGGGGGGVYEGIGARSNGFGTSGPTQGGAEDI